MVAYHAAREENQDRTFAFRQKEDGMAAQRIAPPQAHERMESAGALLVCAYDEPQKFERNHLEGAISLPEFQSQAESLPKDREIIFYCA
jgi:rhodanese-related sulfurtransferase